MVSNITQKSTAINTLDAIVLVSVGTLVGYVYARCQAAAPPSLPSTIEQKTALESSSPTPQDTDETNEPLIRKLRTYLSARNSHYQIDLILPSDERFLSLNAKKLLSTLDRALGSTNPNEGFSSLRHINFLTMPPYLQQLMPRVVTRTNELDLQEGLTSLIRDNTKKPTTWSDIYEAISFTEPRLNTPVTYDLSRANPILGSYKTPINCLLGRTLLGLTCLMAPALMPQAPAWLKATAFLSVPFAMNYDRTKYEATPTGNDSQDESAVEGKEKMIQIGLGTLQPPEKRSWLKRSTIDRIWTPQRDEKDQLPGAPLLKTISVDRGNIQHRISSVQAFAKTKTTYIKQKMTQTDPSPITYCPFLSARAGIFPFVTMEPLPGFTPYN
ncbi:MAG: hypothetical protein WCG14_00420 [Chlamydiia bacterium]